MIKLWVLLRLIRGVMFISLSFTRMIQAGWKSKLINCFRNVITCLSVNVRKFTSWISGKLCLQTWWTKLFYWTFAQKIINWQFSLLWYWKCQENVHLLDLHIKTVNFLSYTYVFNSSQKWVNILVQISYFLCWSIW